MQNQKLVVSTFWYDEQADLFIEFIQNCFRLRLHISMCVGVSFIGFCILLTSSRLKFKQKKTCIKIVSFIKLQMWINLTKNDKFCSKDRFVRSFRMFKCKLSVRFSVSKFAIFKVRFFYFCICKKMGDFTLVYFLNWFFYPCKHWIWKAFHSIYVQIEVVNYSAENTC